MKQLVILKAAGVHPDRIRIEMRGLRATDRSRPGVVVVLIDFYGPDHHLVIIAASVTSSIYRNSVLVQRSEVPGYAATQREQVLC